MKLHTFLRRPYVFAVLLALLLLLGGAAALLGFLSGGAQTMAVAAPPVCGQWETRTNLPTGLFSTLDSLGGVGVVSKDDVWFAGAGHDAFADRAERTVMLHWDGKGLSQVASPSPYAYEIELNDVEAVAKDDVWAAGWYGMDNTIHTNVLLMHWDGKQWAIVPDTLGLGGKISAISVVAPDNIWAVGSTSFEVKPSPMLMRWDGNQWDRVSLLSMGLQEANLNDVVALARNDVWVAGSSAAGTLLLHWDGSTWRKTDGPKLCNGYHYLNGMSALSPTDIWAVGSCSDDAVYFSSSPRRNVIAHFDGTQWSLVPSPNPQIDTGLSGVVAISVADIWAVGSYNTLVAGKQGTFRGADTTQVLHFDGREWRTVASPNLSQHQGFYGVSASQEEGVWAIGLFSSSGSPNRRWVTRLARRDCSQ